MWGKAPLGVVLPPLSPGGSKGYTHWAALAPAMRRLFPCLPWFLKIRGSSNPWSLLLAGVDLILDVLQTVPLFKESADEFSLGVFRQAH